MTEAVGDIATKEALSTRAPPLDILLQRLAAGGDAAPAYECLRLRLVTYFRWLFPAAADALADETIDRLARRLHEGTAILNLAAYALGIARLLVLETGARLRNEGDAARAALQEMELNLQEVEPDPALPALRGCLEAIGAEAAAFILDYYAADGGAARIVRRQALAERSGMSLNALRNRALRIRMGLEKCVQARLQTETPALWRRDESANTDTKKIMQSGPLR